jgi:anti-sigma28 factor (negative regulator of flagellin synthesis)
MLISNISQSQTMQGELRKVDGSPRRAKSEQPAAKEKGGAEHSDRSDLSTDGKGRRDVQSEVKALSSMVKAQPDVRPERVAEAKLRVSNGYYNTESFAETLASKMIDTVI